LVSGYFFVSHPIAPSENNPHLHHAVWRVIILFFLHLHKQPSLIMLPFQTILGGFVADTISCRLWFAGMMLVSFCLPTGDAQQTNTVNTFTLDGASTDALQFRNLGPFRGGRSAAVTGVSGKPGLFYFGGTGGGIWRTQDGGLTWSNISDGYFGGSIGSIEVAASDNNVLYAGGGEVTVRGNVSSGNGIWKSEDAGKTWKFAGLPWSRHIPRIRIHPNHPDLVYAAVLGDLYKDTQERGVYRSKDGGKSWERVLFSTESAGAVDLCMDPTNPRILYATCWKVRRTPFSLSSGGDGSGIWKSTDGGDTWVNISRNEGLPKDNLGIIGVAVSPVRPERVWAIVESETGGVFRSDDGGKTWNRVNEDRTLRQRAWYYTRIYADTKNEDQVYVVNVAYHKSTDGGRTFTARYAPHGDHHDLWIDPVDSQRMIIGDDGGAQTSMDGGQTWTTYHNQPTAQFYRVTTDQAFPYRIYAAQQDNSTIRIAHRTEGGSIGERDWEPTAGGESGHIAVDPLNNDIVYGGEYHGFLSRVDHQRKSSRIINVWPEDNMGHGAEDAKFRFQWNFPLFFSPHNPSKLYAASNHLHVTYNEGQSWQTISPDLTTNDKNRQKSSGGPITQDNTSVEYYCTIFAAAESPRVKDLLWTGSDDGLVFVSRNGGAEWKNVTPAALPPWTMINALEADPHHDGGCFLACTGYKQGDFQPYLFYTRDYGKTWMRITKGIDDAHFTRVVRADPVRPGLLYCGTEAGLYLSFDNGKNWTTFQQNLPIVPITDLLVKENDLIVATQGRSLWILDDLSVIRQWDAANKAVRLYAPAPAYRTRGVQQKGLKTAGENRANGVFIYFDLPQKLEEKDTVSLLFLAMNGDTIGHFSNYSETAKLPVKQGNNLFVWNMRYPDSEKFEGMVLWSYNLEGPKAVPGKYRVQLRASGAVREQEFLILADPRTTTGTAGYDAQLSFVQSIGAKITEMHRAIKEIRLLREQLKNLRDRVGKEEIQKSLLPKIEHLDTVITQVETSLYQTKNRSSQDPLNFPVRLNDKLANLMGMGVVDDFPPTDQALQVRDYLFEQVDDQLSRWRHIKEKEVPQLNKMIRESAVNFIKIN
jgi:photosystem II stability/assembly factor-like uncharacterized protein